MNEAELKALSKTTGIDITRIARWHYVHGPQYYRHNARGKLPRPKGTIMITDIQKKYGVYYQKVKRWLRNGLKTQKHGQLVLVREVDVKRLVKISD